jgi:hypothetical protein
MAEYLPGDDADVDYTEIGRRVRRRVRRKLLFILTTAINIINILGVTVIAPATYQREFFWAWMVLWIIHAVWFVYQVWVERALQREIRRERQSASSRLAGRRKQKRAEAGDDYWTDEMSAVRLSESEGLPDGEPADLADLVERKPKRKRS